MAKSLLAGLAPPPDNPPVSWLYKTFVRPNFFQHDPEETHNLVINQLAWAARRRWALGLAGCFLRGPRLPIELFGLTFPNPLGLAAGMDKGGSAIPAWAALGLGFSELGGVTRHGQPGNPQPRMFRVVEDKALAVVSDDKIRIDCRRSRSGCCAKDCGQDVFSVVCITIEFHSAAGW